MLQKMEILNFPPVSVELEMTTTAEGNPPFCRGFDHKFDVTDTVVVQSFCSEFGSSNPFSGNT